jgi:hypothetical protein
MFGLKATANELTARTTSAVRKAARRPRRSAHQPKAGAPIAPPAKTAASSKDTSPREAL